MSLEDGMNRADQTEIPTSEYISITLSEVYTSYLKSSILRGILDYIP